MFELILNKENEDCFSIAYYHDKHLANMVARDLEKRFSDLNFSVVENKKLLFNPTFNEVLNKVEKSLES